MYIPWRYGLLLLFTWIPTLSAFDANEDIYFELYTNENPENYQVIRNAQAIRSTTFSPFRPTRIFVHGFRSDRTTIKQYAKGFLTAENVNFIAMNWIDGAETLLYPVAKNRVEEVSERNAVHSMGWVILCFTTFLMGICAYFSTHHRPAPRYPSW